MLNWPFPSERDENVFGLSLPTNVQAYSDHRCIHMCKHIWPFAIDWWTSVFGQSLQTGVLGYLTLPYRQMCKLIWSLAEDRCASLSGPSLQSDDLIWHLGADKIASLYGHLLQTYVSAYTSLFRLPYLALSCRQMCNKNLKKLSDPSIQTYA